MYIRVRLCPSLSPPETNSSQTDIRFGHKAERRRVFLFANVRYFVHPLLKLSVSDFSLYQDFSNKMILREHQIESSLKG